MSPGCFCVADSHLFFNLCDQRKSRRDESDQMFGASVQSSAELQPYEQC